NNVYCFSWFEPISLPGSLPPCPGSRQTVFTLAPDFFLGGVSSGRSVASTSSCARQSVPLCGTTGYDNQTRTPLIRASRESAATTTFDHRSVNCSVSSCLSQRTSKALDLAQSASRTYFCPATRAGSAVGGAPWPRPADAGTRTTRCRIAKADF